MRTDVRAALNNLTGTPARMLVGALLVADVVFLGVIVVVDQRFDGRRLLGLAVGVLVLGGLALLGTFTLGDGIRANWLRHTGPGWADPDRRQRIRRLAARSLILTAAFILLLWLGPPVVVNLNSPAESSSSTASATAVPTPTPLLVSPDYLA